MNRLQLTAGFLALVSAPAVQAHGVRWSVGINVGPGWGGYGYYRPYYPYYGPYYRPYVYAVPPAVVYEVPPPVVVRPSAVVVPSYSSPATSEPPTYSGPVVTPQTSAPQPVVIQAGSETVAPQRMVPVDQLLQHLQNPDERARQDAIMELGRSKSDRAIDPLAATLAGDRSPGVRDAAARALGLIGSPRALTALTHAAQADQDRDVRRSAQFAVEVIQSNRR